MLQAHRNCALKYNLQRTNAGENYPKFVAVYKFYLIITNEANHWYLFIY